VSFALSQHELDSLNSSVSAKYESRYLIRIDWALQRQLTMSTLLLGLFLGAFALINEVNDKWAHYLLFFLFIFLSYIWIEKFIDYQGEIINNQIRTEILANNQGLDAWNYISSAESGPSGYLESFLLKYIFFIYNPELLLYQKNRNVINLFIGIYVILSYYGLSKLRRKEPFFLSFSDMFRRIFQRTHTEVGDLAEAQRHIEIEFKNPNLLREALTHASCLNEPSIGYKRHNEALAWLGDALIHWVVSEREYRIELSKEELTDHRKKYVNKSILAGLAVKFRLDEALILPEGQEKIGGRTNERNLHTVFEAVVGALFRDQGFDGAKRFVLDTVFAE
jgi:hypothetical protein